MNSKGSKLWRVKYHINGVERKLAIGAYPVITLAEARPSPFTLPYGSFDQFVERQILPVACHSAGGLAELLEVSAAIFQ